MVNNSTNINQNHLSLQLIEWWSTIPPISNELRWEVIFVDIGGIVDHHSMRLGERWFLLILVELLTIIQWVPLTSTHWVMANKSTNINKHHLSLQLIEWWSTIPQPIWTKITPLLILLELLTITQWVKVRGDFYWYWWNCWHHSMSYGERWCLLILVELLTMLIEWCQQFHQYQ
jgi:hypothetical protein